MVASGTATIEAALMRCPMIVVYKVALLTYLLGRLVVRIPRIGMVNIVAGRALCPEFVQGAATPAALAGALEPLLAETPERAAMVAGLRRVHAALGPGGSDGRAADIIVAELRSGAQGG
jgi:lipid-A-disaccharide synthase